MVASFSTTLCMYKHNHGEIQSAVLDLLNFNLNQGQ